MTLVQVYTSSPVSYLAAPKGAPVASQALAVTSSSRPSPPKRSSRCHAATRMVCKPCMWSERSRHRRLGTAPGSLGKVAVLAVRFSQPPCHRLGISHVAVHTLPRHPIDPLPWGVIGYQRQIDQTRLKIDAQPASQSLICATMTIRLSLTASSPHSNAGHAGGNSTD